MSNPTSAIERSLIQVIAQLRKACSSADRAAGDLQRDAALWFACRALTSASSLGFATPPQVERQRLQEPHYLAAVGFLADARITSLPPLAVLRSALEAILRRSAHTPERGGFADDPLCAAGLFLLAKFVADESAASTVLTALDEHEYRPCVVETILALANPSAELQSISISRAAPEDLALVVLCGRADAALAARVFPALPVTDAAQALLEALCLNEAQPRGDFSSMLILAALETPNFFRDSIDVTSQRAAPGMQMSMGVVDPAILLALQREMQNMSAQEAIKVLFLSANPSDTARVNLDEEIRQISQRVRRGEYRKLFDIRQAPSVRATDLPYELMDNSPEVVHFSGHGTRTGELVFVRDGDLTAHPIPGSTLGRVFRQLREKVKCVVLNACYSDQQAQAIAESIPCVIGMSRAVPDSTAIAFSAGFYEALAFGKSIADAFELGLTQIELTSGVDPQSSDIPRFLVRAGEDATKIYLARPAEIAQERENSLGLAASPMKPAGVRSQKIGNIVSTGKNAVVRIGQYGMLGDGTSAQEVAEVSDSGQDNQIVVEQREAVK